MPLDPKYLEILHKNTFNEEDYAHLNNLAKLVRERILEVVSKNGGHLSSTLGAVELIIACIAYLTIQKIPLFLMLVIKPMRISF